MKPFGDLDTYWTGYLALESEFRQFVSLVPLIPDNSRVISPKLADLASSTGNWIDTVFKRMAKAGWNFYNPQCDIPNEIANIDSFRRTFETPYRLSKRRVFVKRYLTEFHTVLTPFSAFKRGKTPEWFKDYSRLKHDRVALQKTMTLRRTTEALAGLFLLNVYPFEMREYLLELGVIHGRNEGDRGSAIIETLRSHPNLLQGKLLNFVGYIYAETPLFKFEFPRANTPNDLTERSSELYRQWKTSR